MIVKHVAPGPQQQRDVYSGPDVENKNNRRARLAIEKVKVPIIWPFMYNSYKRRIVSARPKRPINAQPMVEWAFADHFAVQSAPGDDSAVLVVVHPPLHQ